MQKKCTARQLINKLIINGKAIMGKGLLIEDISLRDKEKVFEDRKEVGIFLAEKLLEYRETDSIMLSIPTSVFPVA